MAHLSFIFALVNYCINIKKVTIMEEIKNLCNQRVTRKYAVYDKKVGKTFGSFETIHYLCSRK